MPFAAQLPSPREIDIFRGPLSDSDLLTYLTKLPRLEKLTLNATKTGDAVLRQFADKLSWCRIDAGYLRIEPREPLQ